MTLDPGALDLRLRLVDLSDADRLLDWANDPVTRSMSFHPQIISREEHLRWLASRLDSPRTRFYIGLSRERPIGQVRFERGDADEVEVSIAIAPDARRQGFGQALLSAGMLATQRPPALGGAVYVARIRPENRASIELFQRLGFTRRRPADGAGARAMVFDLRRPAGDADATATSVGHATQPALFLGRADSPILAYLREVEPAVQVVDAGAPFPRGDLAGTPVAVMHGYRRILRPAHLEQLAGHVINCHISLLPWNRGADPNLWSILEDTPKGVSIHFADAGIDTGDLIAQRGIEFDDDETLRTTYATLQSLLVELFRECWPVIRDGTAERAPQPPGGSFHSIAERATVAHLLRDAWDTRVGVLRGVARSSRPPST